MIRISSEAELKKFVRDVRRDAENDRQGMALYAAKNRSYAIGAQWIQQRQTPGGGYQRLTRQLTDWVGRNGPIRATMNRTTKYVVQVTAATNPARMDVDAQSRDRATDVVDAEVSDTIESVANVTIENAGLLGCARVANAERVIAGDHGIGLSLEKVKLDEGEGNRIKAFEFDAARLTLDPHNRNRDLRDHEYVIYTDVFTKHRVEREFGGQIVGRIPEKDWTEVGKLAPTEVEFHTLSGGQLYSEYYHFSRTPGALVHFVHIKTPDGRFGKMYVVLEHGDNMTTVGFKDSDTPFGGDGLPYVVLRGYLRPQSRRSVSDVGMMIDDQDKLNLIASLYLQQIWNYTGQGKWIADRSWFGASSGDDHEIISRFQNNILLTERSSSPTARPPQFVPMPEPSQSMEFAMARNEESMREQSFRSEAHQGRMKTHVPTRNAQMSVELAELPLDDRIQTDVMAYEQLINVMTGTAIRRLQESDPVVAASLVEAGFGAREFSRIVSINPNKIPTALKMRQQSIRYRSRTTRRQDLFDLLAVQGIDPQFVRRVMANELDMPLSDLDKQANRFCNQMAEQVMLGAEFVPLDLGEYSGVMTESLTRAMTGRTAQTIPGAIERLNAAIELHRQADLQRAAEAQGALAEPETPPQEQTLRLGDLLG